MKIAHLSNASDGFLRSICVASSLFRYEPYLFSIDGLTLVDVGISKASAVGDVYDLKDISQFEGTYVAGEAGFALAGGMGGMSLRNQNGVVMHVRSVTQGAKLQLGPSGLTIKLK